MRVEPYGVDSIVHVTQRGVRGMDIVRDGSDRTRFARSLLYLNDEHADPNWHTVVSHLGTFERPQHWPEHKPLTRILAWTLLSNHFHLVLQEISEGGIAKFLQRLGGSMTLCFNSKYREKGSLFQGSYHGRLVSEGEHLSYLAFYVLIKNTLEMYPGGLTAALADFDNAWQWAAAYSFSSLGGHVTGTHTPIIDDPDELMAVTLGTGDSFKQEAKDLLEMHMASHGEEYTGLMLESW